jgi:hypothetical protein
MKHHGFTAREAMGWLRIVRPGSVIGQQQQFLCDKEELMHQCGDAFRRRGGSRRVAAPANADLAAVEAYVAAAAADIRSRVAAIHGAAAPPTGFPPHTPAPIPAEGAAAAAAEAERLAAHVSAATNQRSGRRSLLP